MNKKHFEELLKSVRQGGQILKGKTVPKRLFKIEDPDVKAIRHYLGLSQSQFAKWMGISVGTLRNWEQGRRKPDGPARVLLGVVATHPEALADVLKNSV